MGWRIVLGVLAAVAVVVSVWPGRRPPSETRPKYQVVEVASSSQSVNRKGSIYRNLRMFKYDPVFDTSKIGLKNRAEASNSSPEEAFLSLISATDKEWLLSNMDKKCRDALLKDENTRAGLEDPSSWARDPSKMHTRLYYKFVFTKDGTGFAVFVGTKVIEGEECNLGLFTFKAEDKKWVQTEDLLGDAFCGSLYRPLSAAQGEEGSIENALQKFEELAQALTR